MVDPISLKGQDFELCVDRTAVTGYVRHHGKLVIFLGASSLTVSDTLSREELEKICENKMFKGYCV